MRRAFLTGCCGLLLSGCAFFGVEHIECLDDGDCESALGEDGLGSGGEVTGGTPGDGDGDGDTGSSTSGGSPSGGGPSGGGPSGGAPSGGGTGGVSTGGAPSGGAPSGGAPSGGTGGMGTGGTGPSIAGDLSINEFSSRFVEIYFAGSLSSPQSLDAYRIVVDDDVSAACDLTGATLHATNRYLVVQKTALPCVGGTNCVVNCQFSIGVGSAIVLEEFDGASWAQVDLVDEYSSSLLASWSFQATVDGGNGFTEDPETPGAPN